MLIIQIRKGLKAHRYGPFSNITCYINIGCAEATTFIHCMVGTFRVSRSTSYDSLSRLRINHISVNKALEEAEPYWEPNPDIPIPLTFNITSEQNSVGHSSQSLCFGTGICSMCVVLGDRCPRHGTQSIRQP